MAYHQITSEERYTIAALRREGFNQSEIARHLGVSQRTVEHHKYNMMSQLGIKTTAELIQYAIKHGLLG